jgi:hypothetical protein
MTHPNHPTPILRASPKPCAAMAMPCCVPLDVARLAGCSLDELQALAPSWDHLELDNYLKDGGRYRRRRHSCFVDDGRALAQTPHRAHWQPVEYNALHGGMHRLFEPIAPEAPSRARPGSAAARARRASVRSVKGRAALVCRSAPVPHRYRRRHRPPDAGRRAPRRRRRRGGDPGRRAKASRAARRACSRPTARAACASRMTEPWTLLLLDDARVIHESTPIQPLGEHGHRDTLVLTWRAGASRARAPQYSKIT